MKTKTSITLSTHLLEEIDALAGPAISRSAFIERVLRAFVRRRQRAARNVRELRLLNEHAAQPNAEATDVLGYQAGLTGE